MYHLTHLPARFPANTKYAVEVYGPMVRRYVEFPDGRKIELSPRAEPKAASGWWRLRPKPAGQSRVRPPPRRSIADWRASRMRSPPSPR